MKKHSFGSRLFLGLVLLVLYLPIVVVVVYSFNDNSARIPLAFTGWTTRWYGELLEGKGGYGPALAMSLRVALWSVLLSVAIGSLGAVGMTRSALGFRGRPGRFDRFMEAFSILPIMIPEIVLGLAFMVIFNALGVRDNVARLVLAHTTFCIPYVFLSVKSRLVGMDQSLFDAARDLGASPRRVLWDITLPLCRPAILSGAFLALAMSLDDFVISFFVYGGGPDSRSGRNRGACRDPAARGQRVRRGRSRRRIRRGRKCGISWNWPLQRSAGHRRGRSGRIP